MTGKRDPLPKPLQKIEDDLDKGYTLSEDEVRALFAALRDLRRQLIDVQSDRGELDYSVEYDNHPLFSNQRAATWSEAVRLAEHHARRGIKAVIYAETRLCCRTVTPAPSRGCGSCEGHGQVRVDDPFWPDTDDWVQCHACGGIGRQSLEAET